MNDALPASSWLPIRLTDAIGEQDKAPMPSILCRDDGHALFYAGKVNALIGESESGKTWLALQAILDVVQSGGQGWWIDLEDSPATVADRLTALGADEADLARVQYCHPSDRLEPAIVEEMVQATSGMGIVVLDSVGPALGLAGGDTNSNDDATTFHHQVLERLAGAGACVLVIDHLPKSAESRGRGAIGAQAKRAQMTGTIVCCTIAQALGRGRSGAIKLRVDKDRQGHVRAVTSDGDSIGTAHVVSTGSSTRITIAAGSEKTNSLRDSIITYLRDNPGASKTQVTNAITGRAEVTRNGLEGLVVDGLLTATVGPRNSLHYTVIEEPNEVTAWLRAIA